MLNKIAAFCIAMLTAVVASAEFTAAEKTQLGKLIMHRNEVGSNYNHIGNGIQNYGTATARPKWVEVLSASVVALWDCHEAMRNLLNESNRATAVPAGIALVQSCDAKSTLLANKMNEISAIVLAENPSNPAAATFAALLNSQATRIRNTNLDTFTVQPFLSPDPPSFPRVVGPHGDSASAREHIEKMDRLFLSAVALGTAMYKQVDVWPIDANPDFREFIRYATAPAQMIPRIWGMDVAIVIHPLDVSAINVDTAASSGLRGPDFFRLLQENSLFNGNPHQPPIHSGRVQQGGIVSNFAIGVSEFPKAMKKLHVANTKEEIITWWSGDLNTLSDPPTTLLNAQVNFIPAFFLALARAWEAGDEMVNSWIMFFHQIPPIPGGGGLTCGPGTHQEGNQCVPDPCPTCPPVVTCGAGTTLVGLECVADPVECPSFELEFIPSGNVSGTVQCVEVPVP